MEAIGCFLKCNSSAYRCINHTRALPRAVGERRSYGSWEPDLLYGDTPAPARTRTSIDAGRSVPG